MKKYSYVGISFIVLIFGIWFFPKIMDRFESDSLKKNTRLNFSKELNFVKLNGEKKKVPDFIFKNQDNLLISNEDFLGKVFVVEFFFTKCPSICIEMNKNMKVLDKEFGDRNDFGIASFSIDPEHDTVQVLKEYAEFINVKSKNFVSLCERKLFKGSKVFIEGMLETRSWDNASGVKQWTTEIVLRPFRSELKILSSHQEKNEDSRLNPIVHEVKESIDVIPF